MRTADIIEKVTIHNPQFLAKHKIEIIELCKRASNKELKWHLALLISRLHFDTIEFGKAWNILTSWAKDKSNSRIVRVNSIQALFELMKQGSESEKDFRVTLMELEKENVPSINARIRKIRKQVDETFQGNQQQK
jgi:hypothetical protein